MGRLLIIKTILLNFHPQELISIANFYLKRKDKLGKEFIRFVENSFKYYYHISKKKELTKIKIFVNSKLTLIFIRRIYPDLMVFRQIFIFEEYSRVIEVFGKHNFQPKTMIDAGGNLGFTSIYFSRFYKDIKILVIEPNQANFEILRKNKKINDLKNIKLENKGVWSRNTTLGPIDVQNEKSTGWGFETKESIGGEIMGVTIEYLLEMEKIDLIDFMKIDIEGAELEVFKDRDTTCRILKKVNSIALEPHSEQFENEFKIVLQEEGFEVFLFGELIFGIRKNIIIHA
ncbi:FkbM family methyltransferase [Belliella kenyensis]|uniref:FkbM family methyltransferase n=1 Tax=Belliella kenyensis TaxID=1472724 RepID=A0ABV8EQX6_9BACT|nr:FkbM family methyltransferase [Belliella kenyensis]MCH7402097.1 FkbM family methyltransferase [Belliella kenyensis]MDN3601539.1 FkbM family methyltransferase [Belliella kenyensis]